MICDACLSEPENGKLKRCSLCKTAWYCNAQCQKKHWSEHKSACKKIVKTQKEKEAKEKAAKEKKAKPKAPEITEDKVSGIVDNERVTIARVHDPLDGYQYQIFMPKEVRTEGQIMNDDSNWGNSISPPASQPLSRHSGRTSTARSQSAGAVTLAISSPSWPSSLSTPRLSPRTPSSASNLRTSPPLA